MKIQPTPINSPELRNVMNDFSTHKTMICKNHPESQFSSKNPNQRSIFVLTTDCKCSVSDLLVINDGRTAQDMTDEQVAQAMGTTIDDQRPEPELIEGSEDDATDMHITDVKIPDYADVQRLENIAWSQASCRNYAREYHKLATTYGEDTLIDLITQYYNGKPW